MKKTILVIAALCMALLLTGCGCKHEQTATVNAMSPGCATEGYSGDVVCLECDETVKQGETLAAAGHTPGELQGAAEATCTYEGYTGDVHCTVCNELLTAGEAIPMVDHVAAEPKFVSDPTCTVPGFTGTVYCQNCSFCFEEGVEIPATGHTPGEATGAVEPTCTSEGYTGDAVCTICAEEIPGEVIPRAEHAYVDSICADCGWKTPGLYLGGSMLFTWDEVVANGYVQLREIEGGYRLDGCEDISGVLVIDESVIETDDNALSNTTLTGVWIPATCTKVRANLFRGSDSLQECVFFCDLETLPQGTFYMCPNLISVTLPETITKIEDWAFLGCEKLPEITIPENVTYIGSEAFKYCYELETIVIPDAVTVIAGSAFKDCTSLDSVKLPASLETIGNNCFEGCEKLENIELPEGLLNVGEYVFRDTAITELVYPSTVVSIQSHGMESLVKADMSAMTVSTMSNTYTLFFDCSNLETVIMPPTLVSFYDAWFKYCENLSTLVLPEILMSVDDDNDMSDCDALTELVWPVTLTDGSAFAALPNLQTIYYRGTEEQWNATLSCDMFPEVEIVFEYTGE